MDCHRAKSRWLARRCLRFLNTFDLRLKRFANSITMVKVDGQSGRVSRDVVVTCPSAINLTQLAASVGAVKAYRLSFSPETIIVEFSGSTDALNGAEALSRIVGVQSAKPSLALNDNRPDFVPNDIYYPQRPAPAPPPFPGYCWHLKNVENDQQGAGCLPVQHAGSAHRDCGRITFRLRLLALA